MRPTSSYDNYTAEQYALYERRIRGLTSAIWLTQVQPLPLGLPSKDPRALRTFRAISGLLTTNSSEGGTITVTGAPEVGNSLCLTVVAPRILHDYPSSQSRSPTQCSAGKPPVTVERISIERGDSRIMHDLSEHTHLGSVDIARHTADVFRTLIYLSRCDKSGSEDLTACRFILSRCWVEVKARVDAARFLLAFRGSMTLTRLLKGWSPRPEDVPVLRNTWEVIRDPYLLYELKQEHIPVREYNDETRFYFGVKTASYWMRTLCKVVEYLQDGIGKYAAGDASGSHLSTIAKSMRILSHLINTDAIQMIFDSCSLNSELDLLRRRRSFSSLGMEPTTSGLNIMEDERKVGERGGHHILRYLLSLISWYSATAIDLPNVILRLANSSPVIYVVKVPVLRRQERLKMYSPIFLSKEELNQFLTMGEIEHAYTRQELRNFNAALEGLFPRGSTIESPNEATCEDFFGSMHNLAISLAVINSDSSSTSSGPHWTPIETRDSRTHRTHYISPEGFVKPASGGFTTASKRCCYCCTLLKEILITPPLHGRSGLDSPERTAPFKGQYGAVVPWTPPPIGYGLGLGTLEVLERELRALLLGGILKNLDHVFSATNEARAHFHEEMLAQQAPSGVDSQYTPSRPFPESENAESHSTRHPSRRMHQ